MCGCRCRVCFGGVSGQPAPGPHLPPPHSFFVHCAALRSELSSAEARLESERKAHHSTKAAAASREHDLEQQLQEGSQALSSMQRALDEGASRLHGLESQLALLHAANAQLEQQVGTHSRWAAAGRQVPACSRWGVLGCCLQSLLP